MELLLNRHYMKQTKKTKPRNSGRYSRNKGAAGERDACQLLHEAGFPFARRNLTQYQERSGKDIVNCEPFAIQVKVGKHVNVWEALREAEAEAKGKEIPMALIKKDNGKWVVVMAWVSFTKVLNPR